MNNKRFYLGLVVLFFLIACSNADENKTPAANEKIIMIQGFPNAGKVIKAMHGGGYTYMQIENGDKPFWVAAKMMNVRRNDTVTWADASIMKNFKSATLRRTFDEILFVVSANVKQ